MFKSLALRYNVSMASVKFVNRLPTHLMNVMTLSFTLKSAPENVLNLNVLGRFPPIKLQNKKGMEKYTV